MKKMLVLALLALAFSVVRAEGQIEKTRTYGDLSVLMIADEGAGLFPFEPQEVKYDEATGRMLFRIDPSEAPRLATQIAGNYMSAESSAEGETEPTLHELQVLMLCSCGSKSQMVPYDSDCAKEMGDPTAKATEYWLAVTLPWPSRQDLAIYETYTLTPHLYIIERAGTGSAAAQKVSRRIHAAAQKRAK